MQHQLPELPFAADALAPHMSKETLEFHHGKHHKTYVEKLNKLVRGTPHEDAPLEDIVRDASGPVFNNAGQHWNHSFFWQCLTPDREQPSRALTDAIEDQWGSQARFEEAFAKAAVEHFGSGWAWLVRTKDGGVDVRTTHDADNPLRGEEAPLLTCDLWEHAYYVDYRNERPKFIEAFWHVVNWEFVAHNFRQQQPFAVADLRQWKTATSRSGQGRKLSH